MLTYKINLNTNKEISENGNTTFNINIPMGSEFGLGLNQELLSNEMFFNKIKADVLPQIVDKEKIVIYPAVYDVDQDSGEEKLSLADEIEINMHFRRRWDCIESTGTRVITDGWLTSDIYGWTTGQTGCECNGTNDYNGASFDTVNYNYDERSDLVGYLGFTDDDIYYQKTKVKKSFLRLMYYDSNALLNKNLLTYSTSFLDAGKLFTKYSTIRNNERLTSYLNDTEQYDNETVLFEPGRQPVVNGTPKDQQIEEMKENEKYDSLRLSSMVTLKDKYNDDASSDGFYIYLFKTDAPSERPMDLYLKVEFNNAKYGKTVNMMLPVSSEGVPIRFGDTGTTDDSGTTIDAFPQDFIIKEDETENFDFQAYYDALYVNVKCKYDKGLRKYVYYFPWDPNVQKRKMEETGHEFTCSNDVEARKITLNFFEPRVNRANNYTPSNENGNG